MSDFKTCPDCWEKESFSYMFCKGFEFKDGLRGEDSYKEFLETPYPENKPLCEKCVKHNKVAKDFFQQECGDEPRTI
jgi:hypothetical protein